MKLFYTLVAFSIYTFNSTVAQNYHSGTITTNNGLTVEGRVYIDNDSKKVLFKKSGGSAIYNFTTIKSATIGTASYSKINFDNEEYLATTLVSGKASLFELGEEYFIVVNENKNQELNLEIDKQQIPGILSLLFNDCNTVRDDINKIEGLSGNTLINLINTYNNCEYSTYLPTETEIKKANTYNTDTFRFYTALMGSFNNTNINSNVANNSSSLGLGLGLAASPSFMNKLQENIYINFDFSMIFSGDTNFKNGDVPLNYKVNSYRFSLGLEYVFNKKGMLSPFLGIGYGYTSDYYNGSLETIDFKGHDQNYFFLPKAGILYQLNKGNYLGLTLSYISEYENDLSFIYGNIATYYPLTVKNSSINLGLNYYF
ncbi:hypothetical protein OAD06_04560 [Flavobacteriaceae bacterium]|nr:hypothetical protein [Flavobacteriaceae bacterium]MDB9993637.1 hypothetical protein [Flavobacteriaceae bacterium]